MTQATNNPAVPADPWSGFNYDAALASVQSNPFAKGFLETNKARLTDLGTEAGQAVLGEIIAAFAAGNNLAAWNKFYGGSKSWSILAQGAAEDVTNTAAMAQRWNNLGEFLKECGIAAAKALLGLLVAGFCL